MTDYPFTTDELFSVCISRQVINGEVLAQGINTPLVMAGYILAKCTHAKDVRFLVTVGQGLYQDWSPLSVGRIENTWMHKALASASFAKGVTDILPAYNPKEFFRPAQIDVAGNTNNIAINKPRMRLPGTGGIPDVTTYSEHVYIYVPRHSRAIFVPKVDFVSGLGHVAHRKRGSGPRYLISDLGQFDWHNGQMRLITYHPGVSIERIQRKTGFQLQIAAGVHETEHPTAEEIRLLREEIDPLQVRKLEMLSGSARKQLLREILAQEGVL